MFEKKWLLQQLFMPDLVPDEVRSSVDGDSRRDIFLKIKGVFDANHIPFFVVLGTCLGVVRENDFIEYDHDMDVTFYEEDAEKIVSLLPTLRSLGLYLEQVCPCNLRFQIKGCHATVDFWVLHRVRNPFYRLLGYKWLYNNGLFRHDYFNKETCYMTPFMGTKVRLPHPYETYLCEHYGDDWRVPKRGHSAIYRGLLSQWIQGLFLVSSMPAKFSGVDQNLTFRSWASFVLKTFFPYAQVTKRYKHPGG